ncbi:thiamine biosynthesis protein ThiF, partial [Marinosulfonomonas sp. PRT-SC04]
MSRYIRQTTLPEVGAAGQNRLQAAHILVVGAGALGCPPLQYLVAAGIGKITVVDPDVVSLSNLHRQTLFREDQAGQAKVSAAAQALN